MLGKEPVNFGYPGFGPSQIITAASTVVVLRVGNVEVVRRRGYANVNGRSRQSLHAFDAVLVMESDLCVQVHDGKIR